MFSRAFGIAVTAVMGAVYAVLTVALGSFGYSWLQVRISEALTPLPFVFGAPAVFGLAVGVAIANYFSPVGLTDLIVGSLLTLAAAMLSYKLNFGRKLVACIYPVVINAFGVSVYVSPFYHEPYLVCVLFIGVGEAISAVLVGYPLLCAIERVFSRSSVRLTTQKEDKAQFRV
jgi:uncharacterized membrane protein